MQRYRVIILLVVFGVLPVVAAFFFALSFLGEEEVVAPPPAEVEPVVAAPPPPPSTSQVLVAARDLPVGTLIGQGDVVEAAIDREAVHDGHVVPGDRKPSELNRWAVREALVAGSPLTWGAVVGPGQKGFLAAVLRPGPRAVTIRVGTSTRTAALVEPGDRVDVILSADLESATGAAVTLVRTIVEDVRVVAIDSGVVDPGAGESGDAAKDDEQREPVDFETATLEVSPAQGDRLVLGEQEGSLSLAVRALATAPVQAQAGAAEIPGVPVGLEELLLSSTGDDGVTGLEERLLEEIAALEAASEARLFEAEARLWEAIEGGAAPQRVRVFRGSELVEVVVPGRTPDLALPEDPLPADMPASAPSGPSVDAPGSP